MACPEASQQNKENVRFHDKFYLPIDSGSAALGLENGKRLHFDGGQIEGNIFDAGALSIELIAPILMGVHVVSTGDVWTDGTPISD